ncbi:N-6 DNA methylase [Opitutaceae bacterium]
MSAASNKAPELIDHLAWLGYIQPEGLVVSAPALVASQVVIDRAGLAALQERFAAHVTTLHLDNRDTGDSAAGIHELPRLFTDFLDWPIDCLVGWDAAHPLPIELSIPLPEFGETLTPTYALAHAQPKAGESPWLLLVQAHPPSTDLTKPTAAGERGWSASPAKKFERLLRERGVPIGLLTNGVSFQLVYAPPKENSGTLTFNVAAMTEISGRLILGAFHLLLNSWTLLSAPTPQRLPALLQTSRSYQASVSEKLAEQVLHALYELLRGFVAAEQQAKSQRLHDLAARHPEDIYGGLVTVLLRLVFVLFAEDRALLPTKGLFVKHYSVRGLFERLRADAERYPDTMEHRFGAWAQLLALFRLIHGGCLHEEMRMPAREGHLFDFHRYPFLEGRCHRDDPVGALPLVSDGVIYGILEKLCVLEGERVSYRTLDVEEIGSVYQTIMGFGVEVVAGLAIALKGKRKKGAVPAAAVVDLEALLELKPADRIKHLAEQAETKLPAEAEKQVKAAVTVDDLLAALAKRIDDKATPSAVAKGGLVLQPNDERRRSGSHYTPRSFTEPIVRKTLEPVLAGLVGPDRATVPPDKSPTPAQILDLKVADIAVGSAAFLVEACRQLGDALVKAWRVHGGRPPVPPDETEELLAMRLVAQRCLYGVDRNPMAVDLAKLSLWLATLAKDHPFTFLDHNLRCGDSLVGLTQKQIEAFTWEEKTAGKQRILGQDFLEKRIKAATAYRRDILEGGDYVLPSLKAAKLKLADEALDEVRFAGDLIVSAYFAADKDNARLLKLEELRDRYVACHTGKTFDPSLKPREAVQTMRSGTKAVWPFHWGIEFPEVFGRENGGFDSIIGNPPFAGRTTLSESAHPQYIDWLKLLHAETHGNADLVSHFFRRAFSLISESGSLGLIATNTIGQGDTRATGLRWICKNGGLIFSAQRRHKWPGSAAVIVSVVYVTKGSFSGPFVLDGKQVPIITAYLLPTGGHDNPTVLAENAGKSFQGAVVVGMGFTFDDSDSKGVASPLALMKDLIAKNERNQECIFPYIGGEEVYANPEHHHHRYVINFGELSEAEARARYPDLMRIVEEKVRPEREKSLEKWSADKAKRAEFWWRFSRSAKDLYRAIAGLDRVLVVNCGATPYASFAFLQPRQVFSHSLVVFPFDSYAQFAIMQSRVHEVWARRESSSMKDDLRYTPTDCFETFVFPALQAGGGRLEHLGRAYYEWRASLMTRNNEGLTDTYNRFHDPEETSPDILNLRAHHTAMDRAVLDAYGWTGVPTDCEFLLDYEDQEDEDATGKGRQRKKPWRYRWPDAVRDEVLARLLKLNAERAEQERLAGEAASPSKSVKKTTTGAKRGRKPKAAPIVVAAPARQLPTDLRLAENVPGLYAVGLVVALLSEAGGTLLASQLIDAFALATQPDQMKRLAPPEYEKAAEEWATVWNEQATPHDLLPALDNLTSANIAVERTTLGVEFSLQDGPHPKLEPHIAYDAWLALRVAETLEPSAALVTGADRDAFTAKLESLTA